MKSKKSSPNYAFYFLLPAILTFFLLFFLVFTKDEEFSLRNDKYFGYNKTMLHNIKEIEKFSDNDIKFNKELSLIYLKDDNNKTKKDIVINNRLNNIENFEKKWLNVNKIAISEIKKECKNYIMEKDCNNIILNKYNNFMKEHYRKYINVSAYIYKSNPDNKRAKKINAHMYHTNIVTYN